MTRDDLAQILIPTFPKAHANSVLEHFSQMTTAYYEVDSEKSIARSGKFVEAALKCLATTAGIAFIPGRQFKADKIMNDLGQLPSGAASDSIRITMPRACRFIYDIASNRGARHDPHEVDPNQMDATAVVACCSWVLAEMIRHATRNAIDLDEAQSIVESLTTRRFPFIEEIEGRVYFNMPRKPKTSALEIGLLALSYAHPKRLPAQGIIEVIKRHRFKSANAAMAVQRLRPLVDEDENGGLKLRAPGMQRAEEIRRRGVSFGKPDKQ
jgi:hypothetical protein